MSKQLGQLRHRTEETFLKAWIHYRLPLLQRLFVTAVQPLRKALAQPMAQITQIDMLVSVRENKRKLYILLKNPAELECSDNKKGNILARKTTISDTL